MALPVLGRLRPKVQRGRAARRGVEERWAVLTAGLADRSPRLWLHASSAGEALQARPLVEAIRAARPEAAILYSFFSPSAARLAAQWTTPDATDYLPYDWPLVMRRQLRRLAPDALILVGAELWPNLIWAAAEAGVPLAQACARLGPGCAARRFPMRLLARDLYPRFTALAAVAEEDAEALRALGADPTGVAVTGDTRIDATLERFEAALALAEPPPWARPDGAGPVIVAGSTWPADETLLLAAVARLRTRHPRLQVVIAPHEPTAEAVQRLAARAGTHGLTTAQFDAPEGTTGAAIVIVDRVGVLYRLYGAADIGYVGGGFSGAVHNTMEPAAWGIPVTIGPHHGGPHEVEGMLATGGLAVVRTADGLAELWARWLAEPALRARAGAAARAVLDRHRGASGRTLDHLRARGLPI
ncbi:MAG: 3-deoxy-D-manno-octulosonic acid transferase [Gemmatimonadota bacterium]